MFTLLTLPPGLLTGAKANNICRFLKASDVQRLADTCTTAQRELESTSPQLRQQAKKMFHKFELRRAARLAKCSPKQLAARDRHILLLRAERLLAQQQRNLDRPQEQKKRAQEAERVAERKRKQEYLEKKANEGETVVKTEGNDENFKDYKPNKRSCDG